MNWMYKEREMKGVPDMEKIIPALPVDHFTVLQLVCNIP